MDEKIKKENTEKSEHVDIVSSTGKSSLDYRDTMEALKQAEKTLPEFSSSYDAEISELFGKIVNRRQFSYSPTDDPVYASYRDRYMREGRIAMQDTMGKAAALTGGYSSSYGQIVGQEQYEAYLQKLNDVLPELYEDAYARYKDEGAELVNRYKLALNAADAEYDRYRDRMDDAKYGLEMSSELESKTYERRQKAYESLYQLILKTGYQADDKELEKTGMSRAQADALRQEYLRANKLLPSSGGGVTHISPEFLPYNTAKKSTIDKESVLLNSKTEARARR